jgi:hypothetical protein
VQARWEMFREDVEGGPDPHLDHRFLIARGRVTLEGHVFGKTDYKFQTEFGKGFVFLRDYYLDQPLGPVRLRVGQWKKPYSRQQITSSGSLQLIDRSITDSFSGAGRDIGLAFHSGYEKTPDGLEWAVGVFNGTGDRSHIECETETVMMMTTVDCGLPTNVPHDIGPTVVARVGFNHGGIKGYSESDLEGGPLRLGAGVSYMVDLAEGESDPMVHRVGADLMLKVMGASLTGGFYLINALDEMGERQNDIGFHAQAGYFLTPKQLEVAARFAQIPEGDDELREILGGLNWFFQGHSLKWQLDGGVLQSTTDPKVTELVLRSQAQLVF